eukprot:1292583-Amphidinium_carterae.1
MGDAEGVYNITAIYAYNSVSLDFNSFVVVCGLRWRFCLECQKPGVGVEDLVPMEGHRVA